MKTLFKWLVILSVLAGAGYGGWIAYGRWQTPPPVEYNFAEVRSGDLTVAVTATGVVQPEEVIDVGAQVAGQILSFGKDAAGKPVDYGSVVDEGSVLARIDDSLYAADVAQAQAQQAQAKAQLAQAEAQLAQANAAVRRSEADLVQLKARAQQAQRDWDRAKKLGPSDALSQSDFDAFQAAFEAAAANVQVGEAAITQAQGTVAQARGAIAQAQASIAVYDATISRASRNLGYTVIKSPVKGVIIDRRVNIGQTVVSSLNAPSLFLIAKDLTRMQVWAAVNEADIGNIRTGQPVTFTADAFPGETFRGEVRKIRLNAVMTQNVVTYTVEVVTDNTNGRLLPYLTANTSFEVARREGVLKVPNAALRFRPPETSNGETASASAPATGPATRGSGGPPREGGSRTRGGTRGTIYVREDGGAFKAVRVTTGLTDGVETEVSGEGVTEGMRVVIGEKRVASRAAAGANPFTPQIGRTGGSRPGGAQGPPR